MRGESKGLRERVLSLRFSVALWAEQGDRQAHSVTLVRKNGPQTIILDPTRDIAVSGDQTYELNIRDNVAVMTVKSFEISREEEFAAFLANAFGRIDAGNIDRLIIDVRENGGGARQLSDRLMAYLTTSRYTPISAVKARIVAENRALIPGSQIGQVIDRISQLFSNDRLCGYGSGFQNRPNRWHPDRGSRQPNRTGAALHASGIRPCSSGTDLHIHASIGRNR